jgi:hypothetical protein
MLPAAIEKWFKRRGEVLESSSPRYVACSSLYLVCGVDYFHYLAFYDTAELLFML